MSFESRMEILEQVIATPFDLEAEMLREARMVMVHALYHAGNVGLPSVWLLRIFQDLDMPLSTAEVDRLFFELEELRFCDYSRSQQRGYITAEGVDLRDGRIPAPDCIARGDFGAEK